MKANIRGTEIYFDVAGMQIVPDGDSLIEKPVLFLIHGGPGSNHIHFKYDSIKLQKYAQLVFIDQRGCGFSKKTKKTDYTLENNIKDIEALRKYLGLKRISILGISYGGIVAQGYAIRYSKNIDKLILVVTAPSHHFIDEAKKNLQQIGNAKQITVCEKYLWNGKFNSDREVNYYFKVMDPLYIYNHKKKKRKKPSFKKTKFGELKNFLSYEVLNVGFSDFLHRFNYISKLKKITSPTLILAGQNDWVCSPKQSRIIADSIPNSKLKIFKKCGHALAVDVNDKYIKEVKIFLKRNSSK
ncbi:MAG TPA: alpha/beta fold hydrolase [Gammaproteobacteria bacterium]|nr:alpha/beta fold hydrolase [Gammaproteobacteria bacterium]